MDNIKFSCIIIILSIFIWARRRQVRRERQKNIARSGEILMEMFADDEDCKKWVDNRIQQLYSNISDEDIRGGNVFLRESKIFDITFKLSRELRERINIRKNKIDKNCSLSKDIVNNVSNKLGIYLNYSSNAIEGSALSLQETEFVLLSNGPIRAIPGDIIDAIGHQQAYQELLKIVTKPRDNFTIKDILNMHKYVMLNRPDIGGKFRENFVRIKRRKVLTAHPLEIPTLMDQLIKWVQSTNDHPLDMIVNLHARFIRIHPFEDGNGRMVRLLCCLISMQSGYGVLSFDVKRKNEYFESIKDWEDNDNLNSFGEFVFKEVERTLSIYEKSILLRGACIID
jgi:Fic family protein